jgi:hypothetical protein
MVNLMYLDPGEEKMLEGERGETLQKSVGHPIKQSVNMGLHGCRVLMPVLWFRRY